MDRHATEKELRRLHRGVVARRQADRAARALGLDPVDWQVLVAIALDDPKEPKALKALELPEQSARRAVANLDAKGMLDRNPDPNDRRRRINTPSTAGWKLLRDLAAVA